MGNLTQYIGGQHYTDNAGNIDHLNIEVVATLPTGANLDPNTLYLITTAP